MSTWSPPWPSPKRKHRSDGAEAFLAVDGSLTLLGPKPSDPQSEGPSLHQPLAPSTRSKISTVQTLVFVGPFAPGCFPLIFSFDDQRETSLLCRVPFGTCSSAAGIKPRTAGTRRRCIAKRGRVASLAKLEVRLERERRLSRFRGLVEVGSVPGLDKFRGVFRSVPPFFFGAHPAVQRCAPLQPQPPTQRPSDDDVFLRPTSYTTAIAAPRRLLLPLTVTLCTVGIAQLRSKRKLPCRQILELISITPERMTACCEFKFLKWRSDCLPRSVPSSAKAPRKVVASYSAAVRRNARTLSHPPEISQSITEPPLRVLQALTSLP